jgi:hypothetical protein
VISGSFPESRYAEVGLGASIPQRIVISAAPFVREFLPAMAFHSKRTLECRPALR